MARVLVIDDDQGIRDLIKAWLGFAGHECHTAANGHEGLDLLRRAPIDLVITDLVMKYDGMTTIRVIRWEFPKIGIIAITGHGSARLEQARDNGADAVLAKPFDESSLLALVGEMLGR